MLDELHTFTSTNCSRKSNSSKRAVKKAMNSLIERTEALANKVAAFVVSVEKNGRQTIFSFANKGRGKVRLITFTYDTSIARFRARLPTCGKNSNLINDRS